MIIIEGRAGKSYILQEMLRDKIKSDKILVIDSVGVYGLHVDEERVTHMVILERNFEKVVDVFNQEFRNHFWEYDWIVFESNIDINEYSMDRIMEELEGAYNKNFVFTIQNNEIDEPIVYYV